MGHGRLARARAWGTGVWLGPGLGPERGLEPYALGPTPMPKPVFSISFASNLAQA
jgi:hypothetical protein